MLRTGRRDIHPAVVASHGSPKASIALRREADVVAGRDAQGQRFKLRRFKLLRWTEVHVETVPGK